LSPRVAVLCGGIGGSRLVTALARLVAPDSFTCVVNTADDHWRYGLRICPDLDTNLYALAGIASRAQGWGLDGDTFRAMERLGELGETAWFGLGDRDLATHLLRTEWLRQGRSLTAVTAELARRMGVGTRLLPMTEAEVETRVLTATGERSFEEYLVRDAARESVVGVEYRGIEGSTPAPGVLHAIAAADVVVLGPSNPISSLGPILAVSGMRAAVRESPARVVGVTSVVANVPIRDPGEERRARCRRALLASRGLPHTASAVAGLFADLLDVFVLDDADAADMADAIRAPGVEVRVVPTVVAGDAVAAGRLARVVLGAETP
jgi:LPPG:FO 2-phospho-L-lactate transferase